MSQYCLGCYYHYGIGTEINFEEAVNRYNRYKKASDNGMVRANIELNKILSNKCKYFWLRRYRYKINCKNRATYLNIANAN